MSAADRLAALEEGEVVEGPKLMAGLCDNAVEVICTKKSNAGAVTLEVNFLGVVLGRVAGKVNDGKITWVEVK
jgi:hypothetical protein